MMKLVYIIFMSVVVSPDGTATATSAIVNKCPPYTIASAAYAEKVEAGIIMDFKLSCFQVEFEKPFGA